MASQATPEQQTEASRKNDILHFQELLEATKVTFPSADYAGTWLDLPSLLSLLRLSHLNKEDQQTSWGKGRPERLSKFLAALEHEVEKVKKYGCRSTWWIIVSLYHLMPGTFESQPLA